MLAQIYLSSALAAGLVKALPASYGITDSIRLVNQIEDGQIQYYPTGSLYPLVARPTESSDASPSSSKDLGLNTTSQTVPVATSLQTTSSYSTQMPAEPSSVTPDPTETVDVAMQDALIPFKTLYITEKPNPTVVEITKEVHASVVDDTAISSIADVQDNNEALSSTSDGQQIEMIPSIRWSPNIAKNLIKMIASHIVTTRPDRMEVVTIEDGDHKYAIGVTNAPAEPDETEGDFH